MKMDNLSILSCNVCELASRIKRRQVFQYFQQKNYNIIFLQETHSSRKSGHFWRNEWGGGKILFSHGDTNARGVAILFARNLDIKIEKVQNDTNRRVISALISFNDQRVLLCNIYAPNEDDADFFKTTTAL